MRILIHTIVLITEFFNLSGIPTNIREEKAPKRGRCSDCSAGYQFSETKSVTDWMTIIGYQAQKILRIERTTVGALIGSEAKLNMR